MTLAGDINLTDNTMQQLMLNLQTTEMYFSEEITSILEKYYENGLTGWGKRHTETMKTCTKETKLNAVQVQVCSNLRLTQYCIRKSQNTKVSIFV